MTSKCQLSVRYRLLFYLGGIVFATVSYFVGLWALGVESQAWGVPGGAGWFSTNVVEVLRVHMLTFVVWQVVCAVLAIAVGHLFDREVEYRRRAEQKANVDGLTDVYNHRYFQERLNTEIARARRYRHPLSIVMADLDNFKTYNDTWGHQDGDRLLIWFASLCKRSVRQMDIVARYGGEEFVFILPETSAEEALVVAEHIRSKVERESSEVLGVSRQVTVSAGIAVFPVHGSTRHALVLSADAALYSAKQQGKNRCVIYRDECSREYRAVPGHVKPLLYDNDDVGAVEALAAMLDSRDSMKEGHSHSVMGNAVELGRRMGLSAEELDNLRVASLLHDIGKIAVPEEILAKQRPLTVDEWVVVQNHSRLGSGLLRRVLQMNSIIPAIKHHHERYDGKGYPAGLDGSNIPLLSRIIAIADAFDAMTNERAYRGAGDVDDVLAELERCAGGQFDPEIVGEFSSMIRSKVRPDRAA